MRWIPRQHRAPVAQIPLGISLVPPAPDARLYKDHLEGGLSDVVRRRPPRLHLLHEHRKSALNRSLNAHALANYRRFHRPAHAFLLFRGIVRVMIGAIPPPSETHSGPAPTPGRSAHADGQSLRDSTG